MSGVSVIGEYDPPPSHFKCPWDGEHCVHGGRCHGDTEPSSPPEEALIEALLTEDEEEAA
jgi:hypothetical protein